MKLCTKCKILKSKEEFRIRQKRYKDHFNNYYNPKCRECEKVEAKVYYAENRDICCIKSRQYAKRERKDRNAYSRRWRAKNKEHVKLRALKYRELHREHILLQERITKGRWAKNNRDKINDSQRLRRHLIYPFKPKLKYNSIEEWEKYCREKERSKTDLIPDEKYYEVHTSI